MELLNIISRKLLCIFLILCVTLYREGEQTILISGIDDLVILDVLFLTEIVKYLLCLIIFSACDVRL